MASLATEYSSCSEQLIKGLPGLGVLSYRIFQLFRTTVEGLLYLVLASLATEYSSCSEQLLKDYLVLASLAACSQASARSIALSWWEGVGRVGYSIRRRKSIKQRRPQYLCFCCIAWELALEVAQRTSLPPAPPDR